MDYTRLGAIPKTPEWNAVVNQITGADLTSRVVPDGIDMSAVISRTLDASRKALNNAADDPGVSYTFYLLTQLSLAACTSDWKAAIGKYGMCLSEDSTIFDLTVEVQNAIQRHINGGLFGATDLGDIAQQSAGESIAALAKARKFGLFGSRQSNVRDFMYFLSTKGGFSSLGKCFFGIFITRFLNFYLSRITSDNLGSLWLKDIGDLTQFNYALRFHCFQGTGVIRAPYHRWYSEVVHRNEISRKSTSRFLAIALRCMIRGLDGQPEEL